MRSTAPPVPLNQLLAHQVWLRRMARALVGDPHDADDLLQEVWVAAMRRPPRSGLSIKGWLATVMRRKAMDRSRAADRRTRYEGGLPPSSPKVSAEELIAQTEVHRGVTEALLALDEPYRSTLVLRYVGGHTPAEMARLQAVPLETVRTRLKRGIVRLRRRLDEAQPGGRRAWLGALLPMAWPNAKAAASTVTAVAATGGVILGSKLTAVAGAAIIVAIATWATVEWTGSDLDLEEADYGSLIEDAALRADVESHHPILERRVDGPADGPTEGARQAFSMEMPLTPGAGYKGPAPVEGRISGRILGPDRKPIQDVAIVFERLDESGKIVRGDGFPKYWGAGGSGWFKVDDLPEGTYLLRVSAAGFAGRRYAVRAGHAPLAITLKMSVLLSGLVVAADSSIALAGIPLVARPEESPVVGAATYAETDSDGKFVFEGLAAGGYVITFGFRNRAGEEPTATFVPVRVGPIAAGREDVEVRLGYGQAISGILVDGDGARIEALLSVGALGLTDDNQKDYGRRYFASSTREGTFELSGLVPGRYSLSFEPVIRKGERPLRGPRATYLTNVSSGMTDLEITLLEGLVVHGRLVDGEGRAVTGKGYVHVFPAGSVLGGQDTIVRRVDAEGRFHTPPLDPSIAYVLSAAKYEGLMPKTVVGVVPSAEPLVVELVSAARITGRVLDADGSPAIGAAVVAVAPAQPADATGRHCFTYVDANGRFALEGLGDYEFRVVAGGASSGFVPAGEATAAKAGAKELVLHVRRGVPFSGRLVDVHDQPIQSPYISATDGRMNWFSMGSDAEGNFRLPGVPRGKIRLSARIDGRHVSLGEFEAPAKDVKITVPD